MTTVDSTMTVLHLVFVSLWVGGMAFMAVLVLPAARRGGLHPESVATLARRFLHLSRASGLVVLLTGGHLLGAVVGFDALGTPSGLPVVAMAVGWVVLMGLVEAGGAKLKRDPEAFLGVGLALFAPATAVGLVVLAVGALL